MTHHTNSNKSYSHFFNLLFYFKISGLRLKRIFKYKKTIYEWGSTVLRSENNDEINLKSRNNLLERNRPFGGQVPKCCQIEKIKILKNVAIPKKNVANPKQNVANPKKNVAISIGNILVRRHFGRYILVYRSKSTSQWPTTVWVLVKADLEHGSRGHIFSQPIRFRPFLCHSSDYIFYALIEFLTSFNSMKLIMHKMIWCSSNLSSSDQRLILIWSHGLI